jgi:hypothetical protein
MDQIIFYATLLHVFMHIAFVYANLGIQPKFAFPLVAPPPANVTQKHFPI